jgi:UDP-2,3-diacylglucosamine pyrophosphatase LpxH
LTVVTPDIHLLDKGPKDDFCGVSAAAVKGLAAGFYENRFVAFLQFLGHFKEAHGDAVDVIQIGDLYELWQEPQGPSAIHEAYVNVLGHLDATDPLYVVGNHDIDLWNWYRQSGETFDRRWHHFLCNSVGSRTVLCEHGFQADFFNNQAQWSGTIGRAITEIVGMMEYIDPDIDVLLGTAADDIMRAFATYNAGLTPVKDPVRYRSHEYTSYYSRQIGKFRSGMTEDHKECSDLTCAIIGHTHRPRLVIQPSEWGKIYLMDCGSWVNGGHEFGVISGNEIAVCQWGT